MFRAYPDYYEVIKNPIGLLKIGSNIKVPDQKNTSIHMHVATINHYLLFLSPQAKCVLFVLLEMN
jgi:hypothetical protein